MIDHSKNHLAFLRKIDIVCYKCMVTGYMSIVFWVGNFIFIFEFIWLIHLIHNDNDDEE